MDKSRCLTDEECGERLEGGDEGSQWLFLKCRGGCCCAPNFSKGEVALGGVWRQKNNSMVAMCLDSSEERAVKAQAGEILRWSSSGRAVLLRCSWLWAWPCLDPRTVGGSNKWVPVI